MSWWTRLLGACKGILEGSKGMKSETEEQKAVANAFFIRVGQAMGREIFGALCSEPVHLVRLLRCDYAESEEQAAKNDDQPSFSAETWHDEMLLKSEALPSVRHALYALSPDAMQSTPIVFIISDKAYGTRARSWVQTFNMQYIKAGGMPIVRLVVCQDASSSAALASCFQTEDTDTAIENRFTQWCAQSSVDPTSWIGH